MKNIFSLNCILVFLVIGNSIVSNAQTIKKIDSLSVTQSKEEELNFDERIDPLPENNNEYVENMLSFAKTFLGTPYLSSGASPTGFDCSGFVSYVLGNFGFSIIHSSYGMAEYGKTVRLSEVRPGDLMFFKGSNINSSKIGHVALVVDVSNQEGIKFIHASSSKGITIDKFNGSKYYVPRYVTTKRLDYGQE
jgi:cell wall-associated NlpC family hydrolase